MMLNDFPADSDGDALRRLASHGSDLTKPMEIDFAIDIPDKSSGEAVATAAKQFGFLTKVYSDAKTQIWTCECTKTILPSYEEILRIQQQLDDLSRPFGGKSDGWGSFGNALSS